MSNPIVGQRYRKRGFMFDIDDVDGKCVYVTRWKDDDCENVSRFKVTLKTWQRQMKDADVADVQTTNLESQ